MPIKDLEFYKVVKYPVITEKSILLLEKEGKITLVVDKKVNKSLIKRVIEDRFQVKVKKVNVINTSKGVKKAIITFYNHEDAMKVATSLGIL